jgi:hypothetical protein
MTIVIPVYNLRGYRFNNFCFLIKQLRNVNSKILVYEQESTQSLVVEKFLKRFNYVSYTCEKLDIDYFNKSLLINKAFKSISTKYGWVMDADFYTDYNYIIEQVKNTHHQYSDFIRPFSNVVLLDKLETESLYSLNKLELQNKEYISNSQDGKYSFIVKTETFNDVGGMNEDFRGWGFQDLDFVQNRLKEENIKSFVDRQAFHLYHDKASKSNAIYNRTLFENLGGTFNKPTNRVSVDTVKNIPNNIRIEHRSRQNKKTTIPTIIHKPQIGNKEANKTNLVWKRPKHGIICVDYLEEIETENTDIKKALIVEEPKLVYTRGGMRKTKIKKSAITYYIKYIVRNYDNFEINQTLLFANNLFSKNKKDIILLKNKIKNINLQKYEQRNADFEWLFPEKTRFIKNKQTTTSGCFLISSDLILKQTKQAYSNLLEDIQKLGIEEQQNALQNIYSIFN